jgi:hypothetical protein
LAKQGLKITVKITSVFSNTGDDGEELDEMVKTDPNKIATLPASMMNRLAKRI